MLGRASQSNIADRIRYEAPEDFVHRRSYRMMSLGLISASSTTSSTIEISADGLYYRLDFREFPLARIEIQRLDSNFVHRCSYRTEGDDSVRKASVYYFRRRKAILLVRADILSDDIVCLVIVWKRPTRYQLTVSNCKALLSYGCRPHTESRAASRSPIPRGVRIHNGPRRSAASAGGSSFCIGSINRRQNHIKIKSTRTTISTTKSSNEA